MKFPITLFKRANLLDKVTEWTIEVEEDKYRTITGYTDGLKFTNEWTTCKAKNLGKKNATTAEEQAIKQAESMVNKRKALGYFESIEDIDNPVYFEPMLAKEWNDEKEKVKYPIASQPKLDGVRCIVKSDGMWSRKGKQLISAPHILESLKPLFEKYPDLILDGELYCHKDEGVDFNKIISCVRKLKPEPEDIEESAKYIKYYVYDLGCIDGENDFNFYDRLKLLFNLNLEEYEFIKLVDTYNLESEEQVQAQFKSYIENGYEGQMLRVWGAFYENKRSKYLLKYKEFYDKEYKILDVIEGVGKLSNKAGTFLLETEDGTIFNSSINGTHEYLEELWNNRKNLIGKTATVKYFEMTTTNKPVPRFPKIIQVDRSWE